MKKIFLAMTLFVSMCAMSCGNATNASVQEENDSTVNDTTTIVDSLNVDSLN